MPDDPPISPPIAPPPGILLVEEYNALGVALSSALKKFAPLHQVRLAHSFAEAEIFAADLKPELFLLDLDPPPASGEIEFFYRLRKNYPDARVLVIAAGTSRQLRAQRGTAGAIQFVAKPFDLADFGAAVQALLGPWTASSADQPRGALRDLGVIDLVQLKCLAGSSAVLRVQSGHGETGEIYLQKGEIYHATTEAGSGQAAFDEIASWPGLHLTESEPTAPTPRTIDQPWPIVLLQASRKLQSVSRPKPAAAAPQKPAPAKDGKKILVVDDTEMLLIFVADVLSTEDPTLQIQTASTGAEGVRQAVKSKPDLVLLDYSLNDTTGDQVCRALRDEPTTAHIPILMMSGHISELIKTDVEYEHVVAALPKPFVSSALIDAVKKALAAGPLSQSPKPAPGRAGPSSVDNPQPKSSTNGHSATMATAPALVSGLPTPLTAPAASEPPQALLPPRAATGLSPVSSHDPELPSYPAQSAEGPTELSVTLSLKVVDLQFSAFLELESARLQLFDKVVAVKMGRQKEFKGIPLESGFRLNRITLDSTANLDTLRLVPTRQPPQLPVPNSSFPVGASGMKFGQEHIELTLTAPRDMAMRVGLTAAFELASVELSDSFEVEALLLRAREKQVSIRNVGVNAGQPFEIREVQLDPSSELSGILVKALPAR
ncbi:MAG: response regulator [Chthoniobacterales bacterium]